LGEAFFPEAGALLTMKEKSKAVQANRRAYDELALGHYTRHAPHLRHATIQALYSSLLTTAFSTVKKQCPKVLDLGAGEGSFTLPFLQLGAEVVAVDISERQLQLLSEKCAPFSRHLVLRCEDVAVVLSKGIQDTYDIVVANSLLHHIPDYMQIVDRAAHALREGGCFICFQDPMWKPSMRWSDRLLSSIAYDWWRLGQGDVLRGTGRRLRRMFGHYSSASVHDNVEYHAVRQGVDQHAIVRLLSARGFRCRLMEYCSFHSDRLQRLGERLGVHNTFGILAVLER
jgi:SAM-dependent methyltransferase